MSPEQELGIKTIFYTIIGPLINPARHQTYIRCIQSGVVGHGFPNSAFLRLHQGLFVHGVDGLTKYPCWAKRG